MHGIFATRRYLHLERCDWSSGGLLSKDLLHRACHGSGTSLLASTQTYDRWLHHGTSRYVQLASWLCHVALAMCTQPRDIQGCIQAGPSWQPGHHCLDLEGPRYAIARRSGSDLIYLRCYYLSSRRAMEASQVVLPLDFELVSQRATWDSNGLFMDTVHDAGSSKVRPCQFFGSPVTLACSYSMNPE